MTVEGYVPADFTFKKDLKKHVPGGRPDFVPGRPRKPALAGGACLPVELPPITLKAPTAPGSPRQRDSIKPWGGKQPLPWMLSPRVSTYRRQCIDTDGFFKTQMQKERGDILAFNDADAAQELLKSPQQRTREWLDKKPFEVTAMLREQSQFSDIMLRKPPHPNSQHEMVLQAAFPRATPPGLENKAHWRSPGLRKL